MAIPPTRQRQTREDYFAEHGLVQSESIDFGPPRRYVTLTNMADDRTLSLWYFPPKLEESVEVGYDRLQVPGLSHQPQQFKNTGNLSYQLEMYFRANDAVQSRQLLQVRKFLHYICYPRQGANDVVTGAPARVMFVWPNLVTIQAIVTSLKCTISRISRTAGAVEMTAVLQLEEVRDGRLLAEDVWRRDTRRGSDTLFERVAANAGDEWWEQGLPPEWE